MSKFIKMPADLKKEIDEYLDLHRQVNRSKEKVLENIYSHLQENHLAGTMKCVCCGSDIIIMGYGKEINPFEQQKGCFQNGTVEKITVGWASDFDTQSFYIAICDGCIKDGTQRGVIIPIDTIEKYFLKNKILPKSIYDNE